jgi:hypothetical protein
MVSGGAVERGPRRDDREVPIEGLFMHLRRA